MILMAGTVHRDLSSLKFKHLIELDDYKANAIFNMCRITCVSQTATYTAESYEIRWCKCHVN